MNKGAFTFKGSTSDDEANQTIQELEIKLKEIYYSDVKKNLKLYKNKSSNNSHKFSADYIILPSSNKKIIWDLFLGFLIVFQSFCIPLDIGFNNECLMSSGAQKIFLYITGLTYIIFAMDIIITFFTAIENKKGELDYSHKEIALNYLKGFFLVDLAANFPFEYIIPFNKGVCWTMSISWNKVMLIFRFFRIVKLIPINVIIEKFTPATFTNFARLIRIVLFYFFIIHLIGVLFTANSNTLLQLIPDTTKSSPSVQNFFNIYGYSIYVGIYLILGNDIAYKSSAEKIFIIIINIIALITNANIFGYIAVTLQNSDVTEEGADASNIERIENINEFLHYQDIKGDLASDIKTFYLLMYKSQRNLFNGTDIFEGLSDSLIAFSKYNYWKQNYFRHDCLFQNCNSQFLFDSLLVMKAKMFIANERIINEGESSTDFYFVTEKGKCAVSIHGVVVKILQQGEFFGETAIFMSSEKRTASVDSLVLGDILYIEGKDFETLLRNHQDEAEKLKAQAMQNFYNTIALTRVSLATQLFPSDTTESLFKNNLYENYSNNEVNSNMVYNHDANYKTHSHNNKQYMTQFITNLKNKVLSDGENN